MFYSEEDEGGKSLENWEVWRDSMKYEPKK